MKYKSLIITLLLLTGFNTAKSQLSDKELFDISKNLDIFNSLFKELNMFYVDSIDAQKAIQTAIKSMLEELDPYTVYYPEDKTEDLKFMTTGEYAGIGATITERNGSIMISEVYENMPAAVTGLQPGDELLEIDDESLKGKSSSYASEKLKGPAKTIVKIKYRRPGNKKDQVVKIERNRIHVNSVPYYTVFNNNIGYIYLSSFTESSDQELKQAFDELKRTGIESLILDVRDNGGGLLDDAVQIVNMFVPKGEVIVSTKGKFKQWDRTYRTVLSPIDIEIPLVVLVNGQSASSAEILAGALQDLDRAVLVGSRTYGKGLVQSTREVAYNGNLKVTISKYYIPSGRCIQAIDYSHRKPDGSIGIIPDSLTTTFYTSKGRPVKDGGGITPDFSEEEQPLPNIIYYLMMDYIFFDYATEWKNKHKTIGKAEDFSLSKADYESFKTFVKEKNFNYDRQSEKVLKSLKEIMEFEGYMESASKELDKLEEKLKPDLDRDLDKYKEQIAKQISLEILRRYYYQEGEIIQSLKNDKQLEKALEVLSDPALYNNTLRKDFQPAL